MWNRELEVAKKAAVDAGREILRIYHEHGDMQVTYKEGNSPLTIADQASNAIIVEALRREFPDYAILSEEEKDNRERLNNDFCFVVDPLDGTKEFLKRNGQFTVNIALAYRHETVMGVIYVPVAEELYYASKEDGAYLEDAAHTVTKLQVSDCTDVSKFRVVMSSSHGCQEMEDLIQKYQFKNLVKIGSSLKGCLVAKGDAEIYYRHNPTMEWDTAAMQCIVEEASGVFRQMDHTPMRYNREDSLNAKGFYILNRKENLL